MLGTKSLGVSSYVGPLPGLQDTNTSVLSQFKDLSKTHEPMSTGAPARATDKQVFHTDVGNIISLFALETASKGRTSMISSSWKIYNYLVENIPGLIKTLSEPRTVDG